MLAIKPPARILPGIINPEWAWFWKCAAWLVCPLWGNDYNEKIRGSFYTSINGTPEIITTAVALAIFTDENDNERVRYTLPATLDALDECTLLTYNRKLDSTSLDSFPGVLFLGSANDFGINYGGSGDTLGCRMDTTVVTNQTIGLSVGAGIIPTSTCMRRSGTKPAGVGTYDLRCFQNGVELDSGTGNPRPGELIDLVTGDPIAISDHTGSNRFLGQEFYLGAVLPKMISDAEADQWCKNPLGPIQPYIDDIALFNIIAPPGTILPQAAYHYRHNTGAAL